MNEIELKPCPFCGGKAEIKEGFVFFDPAIVVRCTKCLVGTQKMPFDSICNREQSRTKVAEVWNRRVGDGQNKTD